MGDPTTHFAADITRGQHFIGRIAAYSRLGNTHHVRVRDWSGNLLHEESHHGHQRHGKAAMQHIAESVFATPNSTDTVQP